MDRINVTILNWEKYNPRKDLKRPTWFAFSNDLLDHPDFADFTPGEFHAVIYLFSQASKRNSENFDVVLAHARVRNVSDETLIGTLQKLIKIQVVQADVQNPYVSVQNPYASVQKTTATDRQTDTTDRHDKTDTSLAQAAIAPVESSQPTRTVWEAYRAAYLERYKVEPTRNAKVNSAIKQLVARLGVEDAPEVVRFFVGHNDSFYVRQLHSISLALKDAEALRTQWLTGRKITAQDARALEGSDSLQNQIPRLGTEFT
jgi:hypothetical protein